MKHSNNLKVYLTLLAIIAIAVFLIMNKFLVYGIVLFGIVVLIFAIWQFFIKSKENEIAKLNSLLNNIEKKNNALQAENDELRNRKLNIAEIKNILDLGLTEINTNFTRTWNEQFEHGSKTVHFIGALQVNVIAKYGIDLKELRIKHDKETNTLTVANINPKFLSFKDLNYSWKIAEIIEYRKPFIGSNHWRKSTELEGLGGQIKEDLRNRTHEEVKNGPEELNWIVDPMRKQITSTLELLLGIPGRTIKFVDDFDTAFKSLDEYTEGNEIKNG
jgi:Ca2+/Na+ antiporter